MLSFEVNKDVYINELQSSLQRSKRASLRHTWDLSRSRWKAHRQQSTWTTCISVDATAAGGSSWLRWRCSTYGWRWWRQRRWVRTEECSRTNNAAAAAAGVMKSLRSDDWHPLRRSSQRIARPMYELAPRHGLQMLPTTNDQPRHSNVTASQQHRHSADTLTPWPHLSRTVTLCMAAAFISVLTRNLS